MKHTAAIAAFLVLGIALMFGAAKFSTAYLVPIFRKPQTPAVASKAEPTAPQKTAPQRPAAPPAVTVNPARREPPVKRAYRWKDKNGRWVLSDVAPPEGTTVEVIELSKL